ncbi:MAG: hypothetical protein DME49_13550 [Verrucomicrobia bacterium]|nr:MAG: hypothetical protein DME49_13550 [Verrucomicrobiota bacterium]
MATATIFYSWQSDTPSSVNRSFIEGALKQAIDRLKSDATVEPVVRETIIQLDKDTQGVPGSPPIADTILQKIEACTAFVADLTLVGESLPALASAADFRQRFFPNPNVLIEYGYALRCHGHDNMIAVSNTAFGESHTDNLPFDLRHLRWPIKYHLAPDAEPAQKKAALEALVSSLAGALKLILETQAGSQISILANDFEPHKPQADDPAVFLEDVKELIPETPFNWKIEVNEIADEGRAYLRLYPLKAQAPFETALEAKHLASKGGLRPMGADLSGWTPGRNVFGAIVYESPVDGKLYHLTQVFLNKELWGIDAFAVNATHCKNFTEGRSGGYIASSYVERMFTETLSNYLGFARESLKLPVPLQLEAGLTGIKGYPIAVEHGMPGCVLTNHVRWTGTVPSYEIPPHEILRPFFDYMWEECGVVRPDRFQEVLARQFSRS